MTASWPAPGRKRLRVAQPTPIELAETLAAVESLEAELREVVVARVWGQLSLEEIGKLCGISTATAFRRYEAALQELRSKLEPKWESRR